MNQLTASGPQEVESKGMSCNWFEKVLSCRGVEDTQSLSLATGGDGEVVCGDLETVRTEPETGSGPTFGLQNKWVSQKQECHVESEGLEEISLGDFIVAGGDSHVGTKPPEGERPGFMQS